MHSAKICNAMVITNKLFFLYLSINIAPIYAINISANIKKIYFGSP